MSAINTELRDKIVACMIMDCQTALTNCETLFKQRQKLAEEIHNSGFSSSELLEHFEFIEEQIKRALCL
jgi:hypothetical protein